MEFLTPVSMRVTQEQFEKDLKQQLIDLGYCIKHLGNFSSLEYLATNFGGCTSEVSNVHKGDKLALNRHYIPVYNPDLFLALAAMTDEPKGIVGEWLSCNGLHQKTRPQDHYSTWRKATKEELIEYFTEKKVEGGAIKSVTISNLTFDDIAINQAVATLRSAGFKGTITRTETITL